jgi:hypothetical protein
MYEQVGIPRSTRELIHRLTELGWLYKRIQAFISSYIDNPSIGLVGQVGIRMWNTYLRSFESPLTGAAQIVFLF